MSAHTNAALKRGHAFLPTTFRIVIGFVTFLTGLLSFIRKSLTSAYDASPHVFRATNAILVSYLFPSVSAGHLCRLSLTLTARAQYVSVRNTSDDIPGHKAV